MSPQVTVLRNTRPASERRQVLSESDPTETASLYTAVDAIVAIWRYRYMVSGIFIATVAAVVAITLLMEKTYISESQVFVRLGRENTIVDVAAGLGDRTMYAPPLNRDAELNSISLMMANKDLFALVVDRVGAKRILHKVEPQEKEDAPFAHDQESKKGKGIGVVVDPLMSFLVRIGAIDALETREKAIVNLQKNVEVTVNKQSHLVTLKYETHDPGLAQEIISVLVEEYSRQHARLHRSSNGSEFLADRMAAAKAALEESEMNFESFKSETNVLSVSDQRRIFVERIAKLENDVLEVDAQLKSLEAEVGTLEDLMTEIPKSEPLTQMLGAGNAGVDGMRQELFRLQLRREELLSKYQPDHPQVWQIEKQLEKAKLEFSSIESQLVESVEGPSRVYEGARLQLIERTPVLDALISKRAELSRQLVSVTGELAAFNALETQFVRLQREMELRDEEYKRLERSWRQAAMDKRCKRKMSPI